MAKRKVRRYGFFSDDEHFNEVVDLAKFTAELQKPELADFREELIRNLKSRWIAQKAIDSLLKMKLLIRRGRCSEEEEAEMNLAGYLREAFAIEWDATRIHPYINIGPDIGAEYIIAKFQEYLEQCGLKCDKCAVRKTCKANINCFASEVANFLLWVRDIDAE